MTKYQNINLTQETKDFFNKNYKSLQGEIKEGIKKWKDLPCSWISTINIVKMAVLSKVIYVVNAIPIKIPMKFFTGKEKLILNLYGNTKDL
jgi:hypothetical protein